MRIEHDTFGRAHAAMFAELATLVAIAEFGTMDRAARHLFLTSSALSRRIQRLEQELGFENARSSVQTARADRAGLDVLEKSRSILRSMMYLRALSSRMDTPEGQFRLAVAHSLAIPQVSTVIIELRKRFPRVALQVRNETSRQILDGLNAGDFDAALVILPANLELPNRMNGNSLSLEPLHIVQARVSIR